MGRGFMRQSVHPMEAGADGEQQNKLGMEDDDWQDVATENSPDRVQPAYRGPSFDVDPTTAPDFMAEDSSDGPLQPTSNLKVNGTSEAKFDDIDGTAEVLVPPQRGSNATEYSSAKSGRLLTFADETGGSLVEMNYSNRTHYSKQVGPGAVQGAPRGGCCVIQ